MSLFLIIAVIFLLLVSQILRVKLINHLVRPHYSIGLRSGLFMNSICSFLNIITPFRLGEIYRIRFLSVRYNSPSPISLMAIIIERLIDSIFLISGLLIFTSRNIWRTGAIQIYFIVFVVVAIVAFAYCPRKYREMSAITQWNRQLSYLKKNSASGLIFVSFGIWISYLLSGYLICQLLATELASWFAWNTAGYRLVLLEAGEHQFTQGFNIFFIFSFLLISLVTSLMGHRSNSLTKVLNGTAPDTAYPTKLLSRHVNKIERTFFLESPMETYWRKTLSNGTVEEIYSGGSGALVYSLTTEINTIRKVGFGFQKYRLEEQYKYMHEHSKLWNFPKVRNPELTQMYFSFDMDLFANSVPLYSYLGGIKDNECSRVEIERLYGFIENGNSPYKKINRSEYSESLRRLWEKKLQLVVEEVHSRVPQLSTGGDIWINGRHHTNLMNVFSSLKLLALSLDPILVETNPHGDPSLSNLLINKINKEILSIDPNPSQLLKNSSIDHGKVLQSLFLLYEDNLENRIIPSLSKNEINYTRASNRSIEISGEYYFGMLSQNELLAINSELMCFASMLRLLPYRLNQEFEYAPIFLAQAIEYGNALLEKYIK